MPILFSFLITLGSAVLWLRFNDLLVAKKIISNQLGRKIIHIGTGPIFVVCWFLFPPIPASRFVAALIPLLITIQFFLIGIGVIKDKAAVDAMSRSGDPKEILKGPLIYGIVFVLVTILFWKNSLIGIISLMILCGGDGFADIVGRRMSSSKLPWSNHKTVAGSMGMLIGGFVFSFAICLIFISVIDFQVNAYTLGFKLLIINLFTTIVESLPIKDIDNITVPITAIVLSMLLF